MKIPIPRLIALILTIVFTIGIRPGFCDGQYTAIIPEDGAPTYFRDKNTGQPSGFAVDVMNEVARRAGISVAYIYGRDWTDIIARTDAGEADLIPSMGISADREKQLDFSSPVETFPISFFIRKDADWHQMKSSGRLLVGAIKGSVASERLKDRPDIQLRPTDSFTSGLFDLLSGGIDVFACPQPTLLKLARESKVEDHIKVVDKPIAELKRAIAVRAGNTALLEKIDTAVRSFIGTPEYQRIYLKWYGKPTPYWTSERILAASGVVAALLAAALLFLRYVSMRRLTARLRISEHQARHDEARMQMLYELSQYSSHNTEELLDYALHQILALTESKIGYIYHYDEDKKQFRLNSWSNDVMKECSIVVKKTCYELEKTGIWGEAVRQRRPIMLNDFGAQHPLKKGYPEGHVRLTRYLTVPVIQGDQILAVVAVANRDYDYTDDDVRELTVVMDAVWKVVSHHESEEKLRRYATALERSNKELEEFSYAASHDLQEPARRIASFAELLLARYKNNFDEDGARFLAYITENTARMRTQLRDLLAYSRLSRKDRELIDTDLELVFERVLADMADTIDAVGGSITRDRLPTLPVDEIQIGAVLQHLLENAIKFRGAAAPRVHVAASEDAAGWTISVKDNGIGIEPVYFDKIFVMFQRLHARSEYPGTGMGLAICRKIIEQYGGRIWVESEPGAGAAFIFTLPLHERVR